MHIMDEEPSTPFLQRTLTPEVAQRIIRAFEKRFGKAHLYLAYHAAFPLALTPDLLYSLWANFPRDIQGAKLAISWIAVADLLLSNLCDEVGHELYEINVSVRNVLLEELKADKQRFGEQRINELSDFLLVYIKEQLHSPDPDIRAFARIQSWTALAYTQPRLAAAKLAEALRLSLEKMDRAEQVHLASLVETFAEPFKDAKLAPLLTYTRHIARLARNNEKSTQAQRDTEDATEEIKSTLGIRLPTLAQIQKVSEEVYLQTTSPDYTSVDQLEKYIVDDLPTETIQPMFPITDALKSDIDSSPTTEAYTGSWYSPHTIEIYNNTAPKHKGICPSCFEEISFEECRIISGKTPDKILKEAPSSWWEQRIANRAPEPLYTLDYRIEMARRECPLCHYLLPYNIERVESTTLAIVGDTFSGKSHYIASLFHQIKKDWLPHVTGFTRFACLTPEVEDFYIKNYFEPFFTRKESIPPNAPSNKMTLEPLIYELVIGSSITNLMIYDTAGEDFEREDRVVQFARFIFTASAFIFAADPVRMTHVFRQFAPDLQNRLQAQFNLRQQRRAVDVVNSTLSLYERYRAYPEGTGTYPPVAIMLSKADLLYPFTPDQYNFMHSPSYGNNIDLLDQVRVDRETRELLREYRQGDLLATMNKFKQSQFFACSATGTSPDKDGHFPFIEPRRCLDPLLWSLYHLGVIKARV